MRKNLAQADLLKVLSAFTDITVIALRVLEVMKASLALEDLLTVYPEISSKIF